MSNNRPQSTLTAKLQVATTRVSSLVDRITQPLHQASTQGRVLLVAAGLSMSVVVPAYAIGTALQERPANPKHGAGVSNQAQLVSQKQTVELTLVSYAVTKEAFSKIIPLFQETWKREKGQEVKFNESYGGSGTQTRAVIDGLEADVTVLALGLDTGRLQKAGLVNAGWEKELPNESVVTRSVVALVTRAGNPKGIKGWEDLLKPGVSVINANPKTSGVARWNFLGLWSSVIQTGGDESKAKNYVTQVYKNTPVLAKDAREASDFFYKKGQGDVLLNYENEVVLAAQKGETGFFTVIPQVNISIDSPVAVVDKYVDKHGTREISEAFAKFLFTPEAQREFAKVGFRPVDNTVKREFARKFSPVKSLYTVKNYGGWDTVQAKFFGDGAVFDQIYVANR
ncbi:sulfate ABC transporter substrate-binding protein [Stenomitos frigidus]|nr:sulfate ABC transporter substrate-binding protein [Stenomitos frigidus]